MGLSDKIDLIEKIEIKPSDVFLLSNDIVRSLSPNIDIEGYLTEDDVSLTSFLGKCEITPGHVYALINKLYSDISQNKNSLHLKAS